MTYDHWKTTEPEPFDDRHQSELDDMSREQLMYLVREQNAHIARLERLNDEERQTIEELARSGVPPICSKFAGMNCERPPSDTARAIWYPQRPSA
jgi:hypothetical protein